MYKWIVLDHLIYCYTISYYISLLFDCIVSNIWCIIIHRSIYGDNRSMLHVSVGCDVITLLYYCYLTTLHDAQWHYKCCSVPVHIDWIYAYNMTTWNTVHVVLQAIVQSSGFKPHCFLKGVIFLWSKVLKISRGSSHLYNDSPFGSCCMANNWQFDAQRNGFFENIINFICYWILEGLTRAP